MRRPHISRGKGAVDGTVFRPRKAHSSGGALGRKSAIPAHDLARLRLIPEDRTGIHHADRMGTEHETGDNTEITAAAAQAPEKILVLRRIGSHEAAVREHHIGLDQIVNRQAIFAGQVARSAAQREATDAGRRNDARRHRKAEGMGRMVHVALGTARPDAHKARHRIDAHAFHRREVDDNATVATAQPRPVMAAAAHRE